MVVPEKLLMKKIKKREEVKKELAKKQQNQQTTEEPPANEPKRKSFVFLNISIFDKNFYENGVSFELIGEPGCFVRLCRMNNGQKKRKAGTVSPSVEKSNMSKYLK